MADKDEINALRAEVRRRQRAANNKISRLRSKGIELGGSDYDVRRSLENVKRYNSTQLRNYLNKLNTFTNRTNAFVPGDSGSPIPLSKWKEYKAEEAAYNARGARHYDAVSDTFVPNAGMTVIQRDNTLRPTRIKAAGEAIKRPYEEINRDSRRITGANSLDKLIKDMRRRNRKDYFPKEIQKSRQQFMDMLTELGNHEFIDAAKKLRDDQFDTLWNYTSFATDVSQYYAILQAKGRGMSEEAQQRIQEDNSSEIGELLQWAQFLPENNATRRNHRGKKGTR